MRIELMTFSLKKFQEFYRKWCGLPIGPLYRIAERELT
jgi:hypothetical protein